MYVLHISSALQLLETGKREDLNMLIITQRDPSFGSTRLLFWDVFGVPGEEIKYTTSIFWNIIVENKIKKQHHGEIYVFIYFTQNVLRSRYDIYRSYILIHINQYNFIIFLL